MAGRIANIVTAVLVVSAVAVAAAVVRREFLPNSFSSPSVGGVATEPRAIDGSEDLLSAGLWLGSSDADVTIVEFADFQCPFCADVSEHLRDLRGRYGDRVAALYRHLPLTSIHPHAYDAAVAAECAAKQRRFPEFHDVLFAAQEAIGSVRWEMLAEQAGVPSIEEFVACQSEEWAVERVVEDILAADRLGLTWTPSVIIGGTLLPGTPDVGTLDRHIRAALMELDDPRALVDRIRASGDPRPWAEGPWLGVREEVAIAEPELLTWFRTVSVDALGRVLLPEEGRQEVVVLDTDLTYVRTLTNRSGFDRVASAHGSPDGEVVVLDADRRQAVVFAGRDLTPIRSMNVQQFAGEVPFVAWPIKADPLELLVGYERVFTPSSAAGAERYDVVRGLDGNGDLVRDSAAAVPSPQRLVVEVPGGISVGPHPFGGARHIGLMAGQEIVHASDRRFEIRITDIAGAEISSISHETREIPVTDDELEAAMSTESELRASVLAEGSPHAWAPLVGLAVQNDENRLWVGIRTSDRSVCEWAVFSREGRHLGSVALPAGFELKGVHGRRLIGIWRIGLMDPEVRAYELLETIP